MNRSRRGTSVASRTRPNSTRSRRSSTGSRAPSRSSARRVKINYAVESDSDSSSSSSRHSSNSSSSSSGAGRRPVGGNRAFTLARDDDRSVAFSVRSGRSMRSIQQPIRRSAGASRLAMQASLALQRRKKDSPQLLAQLERKKVREVDYNKNPTLLYQHLEKRKWREAAERCRTHGVETRTWVYRMDKHGDMMWRMLPLHVAVLYRAPTYLLMDLLEAFPTAAKEHDDRKMLPLHMACRIICKEDVLRVLLKHNPLAVEEEDIKGRKPMDFLKEAKEEEKNLSKALQKASARARRTLMDILMEYDTKLISSGSESEEEQSRYTRSSRRRSGSISPPKIPNRRRDGSISPKRRSMDDRSRYDDYGRPTSSSSYRRPGSRGSSRSERSSSRKKRNDDSSIRHSPPRPSTKHSMKIRRTTMEDDGEQSIQSRQSRQSKSSVRRNRGMDEGNRDNVDVPSRNWDDFGRKVREEEEDERSTDSEKNSSVDESRSQSDGDDSVSDLECSVDGSEDGSRSEYSDEDDESTSDDSGLKEDDLHDKKLSSLWRNVKSRHDFDGGDKIDVKPSTPEEIEKEKKKKASKLPKFQDPRTELKKLLAVLNASKDTEVQVSSVKKKRGSRSKDRPILPRSVNVTSRRVNACGALKALAKNEKNRLRLVRVTGLISSLCGIITDPDATTEERLRCSSTLFSLSIPHQNCEAILHAYDGLLNTLVRGMEDEDPKVQFNTSFCAFMLTKSEDNRIKMYSNSGLMQVLESFMIPCDNSHESEDDREEQGGYQISRSPSTIMRSSTFTDESKSKSNDSKLNALKTVLNMSKVKSISKQIARSDTLIRKLMETAGQMTPEENVLNMAILTNITRDKENTSFLVQKLPGFTRALIVGVESSNPECQKCAMLAMQNLSFSSNSRKSLTTVPNLLSSIAKYGFASKNPEAKIAAIQALKNLTLEPANVLSITNSPGVPAALMALANEKRADPLIQYEACDALATMAQWLYSTAEVCIEKHDLDMGDRYPLGSQQVSTYKQWQ